MVYTENKVPNETREGFAHGGDSKRTIYKKGILPNP